MSVMIESLSMAVLTRKRHKYTKRIHTKLMQYPEPKCDHPDGHSLTVAICVKPERFGSDPNFALNICQRRSFIVAVSRGENCQLGGRGVNFFTWRRQCFNESRMAGIRAGDWRKTPEMVRLLRTNAREPGNPRRKDSVLFPTRISQLGGLKECLSASLENSGTAVFRFNCRAGYLAAVDGPIYDRLRELGIRWNCQRYLAHRASAIQRSNT
jgi:hypothetical protein